MANAYFTITAVCPYFVNLSLFCCCSRIVYSRLIENRQRIREKNRKGFFSSEDMVKVVTLVKGRRTNQKAKDNFPNIDAKILWRQVSLFIVH